MTTHEIIQILIFLGLIIGLTPPVGGFMARVFEGKRTFLSGILGPLERWIYRLGRVDEAEEMSWKRYLIAVVVFNMVGCASLFALLMGQALLPLNPQKFAGLSWHLAFNTAMSFTTNTDWQSYMGESTMSYFSQMAGLAVHNFLSASTAIAVMVAMIRGFQRASMKTLGNFWVDLTRSALYVLLPLSAVMAVALMSQGVVQNFKPYASAKLVEPYTTQVPKTDDKGNPVNGPDGKPVMVDQKVETQDIPTGPVASQISIKQLGTNGGGFYGQNSAHPFENPTPLSGFIEMLAILLLPAALVYTYGVMVGDRRHAWCLFGVMMALYLVSFSVAWWAETRPNPVVGNIQPLLEGKEVRNGVMNSVLWGTACTATSNGSVNSMHDSWMPLAGLMPMWNIQLGEIAFGGIGCGMYGILLHVLLTVFIAGLMIGRTPEYLGKKLGAWEASWAVLGLLVPSAAILLSSAISCVVPAAVASTNNAGPHGMSEILYAYSEAANNNGSAFAGLNANTVWYNTTMGACMFIGRFIVIAAALAIAGNLATKKTVEASGGTLPTNGLTFSFSLLGVIVIVAALTFFPVLCLGPIVEHGLMLTGRVF